MSPKEQAKLTRAAPKKRVSKKKAQSDPEEDDDKGDDADDDGDDNHEEDDDDNQDGDSDADSSGGTKFRAKADAKGGPGRGRGRGKGRGRGSAGRGRGRSAKPKGSGKGQSNDKVVEARSASVKRGPADAGKAAGRKKSKGADQGPADAEAASRKKSKGADKPGETKSSETSAPKAKAKGKAKATEQADAEQEEKKKKSRKSCAYHRAKATAIKDGKTAEQAKEAAKKVASLKLPSAFVYGFIINYLARHACTLSAVMATYKTLKVRTSSLNSETLSPGLNPPQNPRKPQPFPLLLHLRLTTRRTSSITCGDMLLVDMSWLGFCSSLRLQGFDQLAKAPADLSIATRC